MTVLSHGARRSIKALLIDLDDTLYRAEGIPARVRAAIEEYMVRHLGYAAQEVAGACNALYMAHGTTMAGLVAKGHTVDYDQWHAAVHHDVIDYGALLQPDAKLRDLLMAIPIPKYILTNADKVHAELCLARLGIADCFKGVFDFEWAQEMALAQGLLTPEHRVMCKPQHTIYTMALQAMHTEGGTHCEPSQVLFFDDSARNIQAAHEIGLVTAVVGRDAPVPGADFVLPTMHALPSVLPELLLPDLSASCAHKAQQPLQPVEHAVSDSELAPQHLVTVAQGSGSGRAH